MAPSSSDIAVVGMACRFPGAPDLTSFWRMLIEGREGIRFYSIEEVLAAGANPQKVADPRYVRAAAGLDEPYAFDAEFFGFSAAQAAYTDPQIRIFLELAWEALEHAGYTPSAFGGSIGVYAGSSFSPFLYDEIVPGLDGGINGLMSSAGIRAVLSTDKDYITTWLSYQLDLRGPAVAIYAACATSLVAIHCACQALLTGECDMALAGGVKVRPAVRQGYLYEEGSLVSPDGRCHAFDASAQGTIFGDGAGIVVLRRLDDALADGDRVLAVVKGSAVNNDGATKVGFSAPGVHGQAAVITTAQTLADVSPDTVEYIEAHGTGTIVGDPIEITALCRAFRRATDRRGYCAIGSVKTNIGHLESGAGVAGFIKAVLALQHEQIPPSLNYTQPNPAIDFENTPFFVNTALRPWPRGAHPRRAGINSFGIGGTNSHVVLEEAPPAPSALGPPERPLHLYTVSARSAAALDAQLRRHAEHLARADAPPLPDAAFTANTGRVAFPFRAAVTGTSSAEVAARLASLARAETVAFASRSEAGQPPAVAFLFTGQGAGFPGMAQPLYQTCPPFRATLDRLAQRARSQGYGDLLAVLLDRERGADLERTIYAQPALYVLAVALAELWRSWGVQPAAVLGHSLGEFAAAAVAGIYDAESGLDLVIARARAMEALPAGGAMAAVFGSEAAVREVLAEYPGRLEIAARNGPESLVISGEAASVEAALVALSARGLRSRRLAVGRAFHSPLMEPALAAIARAGAGLAHARPSIPFISNLSGAVLEQPEGGWARYWAAHARQPVRFAESLETLKRLGIEAFVEVGPGSGLLAMARESIGGRLFLPSLQKDEPGWTPLLHSLGQLFTAGLSLNWAAYDHPWPRRRVTIPSYPFQRKTYGPLRPREPRRGLARSSDGHPLRGARLDTAFPAYEGRVDLAAQPWLADHVVGGRVLLPGAAMLEAAGSAAVELLGSCELRDVSFLRPMPLLPEQPRDLQLAFTPDHHFSLYSRLEEERWEEHASGRAVTAAPPRTGTHLADWLAECTEALSPDLPYHTLAARKISFGERFRAVQKLWRRPENGRATRVTLSRLSLPVGVAAPGWLAHPVLLDGGFQTAVAAFLDRKGPPIVPASIETVRIYGPLPAVLYCRAEIPTNFGQDGTADICFCDEAGAVRAEFCGLRGAILELPEFPDWVFAPTWQPLPGLGEPPRLANPATLRAALSHEAAALTEPLLHAWTPALQAWFDGLVTWATGQILDAPGGLALGEHADEAVLAERLGVIPTHRRVFHRLLGMLGDDGVLLARGLGWERRGAAPSRPPQEPPSDSNAGPSLRTPALLWRVAEQLLAVLTGKVDALEVLFPGGSMELVEDIYQRSPVSQQWNRIAARLFRELLLQLPPGRALRVLEIGAGTASTTEHLLPQLTQPGSRYLFTDISQHFLNRARVRFGALPAFAARTLDIDRPLADQGWSETGFDVVVAANVLHATTDLRQTLSRVRELLSPGGILILLEAVRPQRWIDMVFGLTEGWWRFHDGLRVLNPLCDVKTWTQVLKECGFDESGPALDEAATARDASGHALLIARRAEDRLALLGAPASLAQADWPRPILQIQRDEVATLPAGTTLLHLAGVASEFAESLTPAELSELRTGVLESALVAARGLPAGCRFYLVTRGGAPTGTQLLDPIQTALLGLGGTLRRELGDRFGGLFDLDPAVPAAAQVSALMAELTSTSGELFVARRGEQRLGWRALRVDEPTSQPASPRADGSYLITGGLGGIGLRLAHWLVEDGAGAVVLLGRSEPSEQARAALAALRERGGRVLTLAVDVGDFTSLAAALAKIRAELPPLRGVFHAAGVLLDAPLSEMDSERFHTVLRPKVDGGWFLHQMTRTDPLDWFVLFSSGTVIQGMRGQTNHAAANAFLDGLAHYRRGHGLPALSVNWGRWSDVGVVRDETIGQRLASMGIESFTADQGIRVLRRLLTEGPVQRLVSPLNRARIRYDGDRIFSTLAEQWTARNSARPGAEPWSQAAWEQASAHERPALVEKWFTAQLAQMVGVDSAAISLDSPLGAAGLDSLMAVELRGRLSRELGVPVSVGDLLAAASVRESARRILERMLARDAAQAPAASAQAKRAELEEQEWEEVQI